MRHAPYQRDTHQFYLEGTIYFRTIDFDLEVGPSFK